MSKEVDALVIIGYGNYLSSEPVHSLREDISQGLWYVRNGKTNWYHGAPITDQERDGFYASEVFLQLGDLAMHCYTQELYDRPQEQNPMREVALDTIAAISPFDTDTALAKDMVAKNSLDPRALFRHAITKEPSIKDELKEKWNHAQAVYAKRGRIVTEVYNTAEMFDAMRTTDTSTIAPNTVQFDKDLNVVESSHRVSDILDHSGLKPHTANVPYYQTFYSAEEQGMQMLNSALEDLRDISDALRS